jgi:hypothetical protein
MPETVLDDWQTGFTQQPAFAHLRPWLTRLPASHWPELGLLNDFARQADLRTASGLPVNFAAQRQPCGQLDYEFGIHASGNVPSRERNWHDLFNALTWLAFPACKAVLNAVHQHALRSGDNRLPASDAATLFDESGLVIVGEAAQLPALLAERRWQAALLEQRADWTQVRALVVGHAVLEKLIRPWPGITAKCLYLDMPADSPLPAIDQALARRWQGADLLPGQLFPLPVLGIPGWWPANENPAFYADRRYFRPLA